MLKGQLDKAIKDYQQVVALEPKEIRYRQKLAELLVRDNRKDEAIAQYEGIAKHYAENSYFLKAIAVYKQIQRLSPDNIEIALTVASLNHKQGLIGNALAEYGQVVAQYEREGQAKEAVKVLEQMLVIDADQAATRLKHAELLFASGAEDASYQAFSSLARSLKSRGDQAAAQQVTDRIAQLFASRQEDDLDAVAARIEAGDFEAAVDALLERLKRDTGNLRAWQLLCDAERSRGNVAGLRQAYEQMLKLFPDDLEVIEGGIRFHIDSADSRGALSLIERHLQRFIEKGSPLAAEALLLSLSADVARDPRAVEALSRVYQAAGAVDKLNALRQDAASSPQFRPEQSLFSAQSASEALPSPFASPLPEAAASQEAPSPWEPGTASSPAPAASAASAAPWEEEIELDLDDDADSVAAVAGEIDLPVDFLLSFDADVTGQGDHVAPPSEAGPPDAAAESPSCFGDLSFFEESPAPAASSAFPEPAAPVEAASPFESGFSLPEEPSPFGEESLSPPEASSPFAKTAADGELPSPFGPTPSLQEEPVPALQPAASAPGGDFVLEEAGDLALELELPEHSVHPDFAWDAAPHEEQSAEAAEVVREEIEELEPHEELADWGEPVEELELGHEAVEELELDHETVGELEPGHETAEEFKLGHEVVEELEHGPEALPVAAEEPPARPLRGWEEIFPEADSGAVVDAGELESHYDLGVGYKEMGMYNKAIKEFEVAAGNPQRRVDCLTLQAACFRDNGEPEKARELLQRGRELDVLSDGERITICYELGFLYESQGDSREAVELYREVHKANPTFHDVAQRLSALTGEESLDFIDLEEADLQ